jgi:hypothetical protein
MNPPVTAKTTRYGLSPRVGGWDVPGDSGTDAWMGCFGNKLNSASCALTVSLELALCETLPAGHPALAVDANGQRMQGHLTPHTLLMVIWPGTPLVVYRTFDDRAPESDPRLDNFLPWKDDPSIPDYGQVSVV